ncbi:pyruvate formate lyase activating enzyme [Natronincola peptidivorans]|uniref:Pyruvate formate lyase activating enzyme n=1 Tax=Natronincola peptidivorans TaxID=426128 RepID=A0A1I0B1D4_9FIRM|nr:YjjW family glycine radical enzyme activase [Natronincola peptidivorans]SET00510.1 pyruvate formate lyase activating enzyme [Natronincola peptidivorans]
MKYKAEVNKIIPFSNVDGPGNRLAIFFQGCNINCSYCHNPETINCCSHCGTCVSLCPTKAIKMVDGKVIYEEALCIGCDQCIRTCGFNASPKTREYTVDQLYEVIEGYAPFIRGVTVSGGEPTQQAAFITELFKRVKGLGLSCFVDTNGFFNKEDMIELIQVTDQFMIDIKGINTLETLCGKRSKQHLENLQYLLSIQKTYEVRTVVALEMVDIKETLTSVASLLKNHPSVTYRLISLHLTGLIPFQKENLKDKVPSKAYMEELKAYVTALGVKKVEIQSN